MKMFTPLRPLTLCFLFFAVQAFGKDNLLKHLFILLLLFHVGALRADTVYSNQDGSWHTHSTWVGSVIPSAGDDVVIFSGHSITMSNAGSCISLTLGGVLTLNSGGDLTQSGATTVSGTLNLNGGQLISSQVIAVTGTTNISSGNYTFNSGGFSGTGLVSLGIGGTAVFNTGSSLTDNLTLYGGTFKGTMSPIIQDLTLNNGTFSPDGNATINGSLTWASGSIGSFDGTASTVNLGGSASLSGGFSKTLEKKTLNLNGGVTWTDGSLFLYSNAVLHIPSGQSLTFNSSSNLSLSDAGTFNLEGNLDKQGSGTFSISSTFNNNGAVNVIEGALALSGNGTHTGTFSVATIDGLQFNGGTHTAPGITGSGSVLVGGGTVTLSSNLNVPLTMTGGELTGAFSINTSTITMSGGTLSPNGGVTLSGDLTVNGGNFRPATTASIGGNLAVGGSFNPDGNTTVSGNLTWTSGSIGSFDGTANSVNIGGAATLSGGFGKTLEKKTLNLNGGATWTGGDLFMSGNPVVHIPSGQQLMFNSSSSFLMSGIGTFNLEGNLDKQGSGTFSIFSAFNNNGSMKVSTGTLSIGSGNTHSGSFEVVNGATLNFSSFSATTLTGATFTNNGTVIASSGVPLVFGGTAQQTLSGNGTSISTLTVDNANGVNITGSQTVSGMMTLSNGKVYLQNGDLSVGQLTGGDASKYIVTSGAGRLVQSVTTSATIFPIGPTSSNYNPVTLQQVSSTADFGVRAKQGFDYPTNGPDYVNCQWTIDNLSGSPNANMTVQWNSPADEQGAFNPALCHISHWNGAGWESLGDGAATCASGACTRSANGVTNFSPFGVGSSLSLPVELTSFECSKTEHGVRLDWRTATEHQNKGFDILRSADGKNWSSIGWMNGQGDAASEHTYSIWDKTPLDGINYYRLKQVNLDGGAVFSPIVSVETDSDHFTFDIVPNPNNGTFSFLLEALKETPYQLSIFDVNGKQVWQQTGIATGEMLRLAGGLASSLTEGIYMVRVSTGLGKVAKRRMVIQF